MAHSILLNPGIICNINLIPLYFSHRELFLTTT